MNPQIADAPTHIEGYSNLTAAILAQAPIDWAQLDDQEILCVNEAIGTLKGSMKRDYSKPERSVFAWWDEYMDGAYIYAFLDAWRGREGWTLWIEGEIPLRRKTADQLEVGTYFYGEAPSCEPDLVYVGGQNESSKAICYPPGMLKSATPATGWVVLEEYGPFQKPEGK